MFLRPDLRHAAAARSRRGLTMVELLMSVAIMGILAGAMAGISMAVQQSAVYSYGRTTSIQNARVALERINRMILTATSAENYPGVAVCTTSVGSYQFPEHAVGLASGFGHTHERGRAAVDQRTGHLLLRPEHPE